MLGNYNNVDIINMLRKAGFLVIDFTWKLFSQTGSIETYLLLKELEKNESNVVKADQHGEPETSSANPEC